MTALLRPLLAYKDQWKVEGREADQRKHGLPTSKTFGRTLNYLPCYEKLNRERSGGSSSIYLELLMETPTIKPIRDKCKEHN